jgi:uncharacterized repeat protein (TIGR03803 family)
MRRTLFPFFLRQFLTILALAVVLTSTGWAKPKFKILHGVPGGLFGGLTFDSKGNLYGGTSGGGDHNKGTIFQLKPGAHGWTLTTLHSFDGYDGGSPNGGLIFDSAGNLYGTSPSGGAYNGGNVFEMTPGSGGWTLKDLYDFCHVFHCPDGTGSEAGVIFGSSGVLYGTTSAGGVHSQGTMFKLMPSSGIWNEVVLHNFKDTDGSSPIATMTVGKDGDFYGTTFYGGAHGGGTVYRLGQAPNSSWKEQLLYNFCSAGFPSCKDGLRPYAGVVFDGSGNLYGTTTQGGGNACGETTCGTIFKLTPLGHGRWKHTVLYDFPNPGNGSFPTGGVIVDKAGSLYGATVAGGIGRCPGGCGVIYKLVPGTDGKWKYTVLHSFHGADGFQPLGGLTLDRRGNLYGTAYSVVFTIAP